MEGVCVCVWCILLNKDYSFATLLHCDMIHIIW